MGTLNLEVITPMGRVFSGEVETITLPGSDGEFGVLPGHASVVSLLAAGVIDIVREGKEDESIAIDWGYAQIAGDRVIVLVDGAVAIRGSSESEVGKALDAAKQLLRDAQDSSVLLSTVEARIEASARTLL